MTAAERGARAPSQPRPRSARLRRDHPLAPPSHARGADHLFGQTRGAVRRARITAAKGKLVDLAPMESCDRQITGSGILRRLWCVFNAHGKPLEAMHTLTQHRALYRNVWIHIAFDDI